MTQHDIPDVPVWKAVLQHLATDDRVTPQMHGFINLAVAEWIIRRQGGSGTSKRVAGIGQSPARAGVSS